MKNSRKTTKNSLESKSKKNIKSNKLTAKHIFNAESDLALGQEINGDVLLIMSEIFKIMGDKTRLKIMLALKNGEFNVGQICQKVNLSQSLVSHQLKILREKKLVKTQKNKNRVFYSLSDEHVLDLISVAVEHSVEICERKGEN